VVSTCRCHDRHRHGVPHGAVPGVLVTGIHGLPRCPR
jgi:hypothetical protein